MKLKRIGVLLSLLLLMTTTACDKNSINEAETGINTLVLMDDPVSTGIYLDDYVYPYYYHLVSTNDELPTPNVVQDKDEHGKYYPYSYSLCTEEQKPFYKRMITAIYNMEPSFDCTEYKMTADDVNTIFKRVLMEMPEFYYLDSSFKYELDDDRYVTTIAFYYTLDETSVDTYNLQLYEIAQSIKSVIPSTISRYDLYVWLHDFVILNATYNDNYDGEHDSDVIGALIDHKGTCKAFAMAFEYLCRQYNITTCIATGEVGLQHVWNVVPYNDDWMHIDVGMDNVDSENTDDFVLHNYIGVTDRWITEEAKHTIYTEYENSLYDLPACTNENLRYALMNNFIISSDTTAEEAALLIKDEIVKRVNNDIYLIEIQAEDSDAYTILRNEVLNTNQGFLWGILDDVNDLLTDGKSINVTEVGCNFEKWDNYIILYIVHDN